MAHPKRKHSHSRTRLRRTHQKVTPPTLTACPQCKSAKPAYVVCPTCGFYRGKQVLEIKVKQEKSQA